MAGKKKNNITIEVGVTSPTGDTLDLSAIEAKIKNFEQNSKIEIQKITLAPGALEGIKKEIEKALSNIEINPKVSPKAGTTKSTGNKIGEQIAKGVSEPIENAVKTAVQDASKAVGSNKGFESAGQAAGSQFGTAMVKYVKKVTQDTDDIFESLVKEYQYKILNIGAADNEIRLKNLKVTSDFIKQIVSRFYSLQTATKNLGKLGLSSELEEPYERLSARVEAISRILNNMQVSSFGEVFIDSDVSLNAMNGEISSAVMSLNELQNAQRNAQTTTQNFQRSVADLSKVDFTKTLTGLKELQNTATALGKSNKLSAEQNNRANAIADAIRDTISKIEKDPSAVLTVPLKADTDQYRADIRDLQAEAKKVNVNIDFGSDKQKESLKSVEALLEKIANFKIKFPDYSDAFGLDTVEDKLRDLQSRLDNGKITDLDFENQFASAKARTDEIIQNVKTIVATKQTDDDPLHFSLSNKEAEKVEKVLKRINDEITRAAKAGIVNNPEVEELQDLYEKIRNLSSGYNVSKGEHIGKATFAKEFKDASEAADAFIADLREIESYNTRIGATFGTKKGGLLSSLSGFAGTVSKMFSSFISSADIINGLERAARSVIDTVIELDGAMTQLQIVTGATDSEMVTFMNNATNLAKSLGQSISDISKSIEVFSRLGYDLQESTDLTEFATILSNVAAVDVSSATTGLTSIIKGFNMDVADAEHVADVLVEVGQKYAVSAEEIMEAFERSGAALSATGTTFEKSAGLVAAANAAVQNASTVGTALKTISARIRGSKTDLEELGEDTTDLAEGFSKYADELEALTGVDIRLDGMENTYKDLYDIFEEISGVWGQLSDTQQARVAEILGGTRQLQVISSILTNWSDAANAYSDAMDSAGVATKANDRYMESVAGHLGQLKATWEEFATSAIGTETINSVIEFGQAIINGPLKAIAELTNQIGVLPTALGALLGASWVRSNGGIFKTLSLLKDKIVDLKSLIEDAKSPGLGPGEGIKDTIRAVVQLISSIKNLGSATGSVAAVGSAFKTLLGSINPVIIAIGVLVAAFVAFKKIKESVEKDSFSNALKNVESYQSAVEDQQTVVKSLNDELDSTKQRITELKEKGGLTVVEQDELNRLEDTNKQLESQLAFEERILELKQEQNATASRQALTEGQIIYNADTGNINDATLLNQLKSMFGNLWDVVTGHGDDMSYLSGSFVDGVNAMVLKLEELQAKREDLNEQKFALDPDVNFEKINELDTEISDLDGQIFALTNSASEQMKTMQGLTSSLIEGTDDELIAYTDEIYERFMRITEGATQASSVMAKSSATISEALSLPSMTESMEQIGEYVKYINGIDADDLMAIAEQFPELQSAIQDSLSSSEEIISSFTTEASKLSNVDIKTLDDKFDDLGTKIKGALEDGTVSAEELRNAVNGLSTEDLGVLTEKFPGLGIAVQKAMELGVTSIDDFVDAINSMFGTVNVDQLKEEITDAFTMVPEGAVSRTVEEVQEFRNFVAGLSDEEVQLLFNIRDDLGTLTIEQAAQKIASFRQEVEETENSVTTIADKVSQYTSGLSSVVSSMSSGEGVDYETFNAEGMEDYASAIEEVNGQFVYNEELVDAINEAKQRELKTTIALKKQQLYKEYAQNTKEINKNMKALEGASDAQKDFFKSAIKSATESNSAIWKDIQNLNILSSTIDDTFSKYTDWLNYKNAPSSGEMFSEVTDAFNVMYDTLYNGESDIYGKIGEDNYERALELLLPDEDMTRDQIDQWFNSFSDYWIKDADDKFTGKLNLEKFQNQLFEGDFVEQLSNGDWQLKAGTTLDQIADKLGTTREAVWSFFQYWNQYIEDAHKFKLDDIFSDSPEDIGTEITKGIESLKSLGVLNEDFEIDLSLSGYSTVEEQLNAIDNKIAELEEIKVQFEDDPASTELINGVIEDLLRMKAQLAMPTPVTIDTSTLNSDLATIYQALFDYQNAIDQINALNSQLAGTDIDISADISRLEAQKDQAVASLEELTNTPYLAEVGIDPESDIRTQVENILSDEESTFNVTIKPQFVDENGAPIDGVTLPETTEGEEETVDVKVNVDRTEYDDFVTEITAEPIDVHVKVADDIKSQIENTPDTPLTVYVQQKVVQGGNGGGTKNQTETSETSALTITPEIDSSKVDEYLSSLPQDTKLPISAELHREELDAFSQEEIKKDIDAVVKIDRAVLDAFIQAPLTKNIDIVARLNAGSVSSLQTQLNSAIASSGGLNATVNVKANTEGAEVKDGTATVTYVVDDTQVDAFLAKNINKTGSITYNCYHSAVDRFLRTLGNKTYTITYQYKTQGNAPSGSSSSKSNSKTGGTTNSKRGNNTASVTGTAFANGSWGTKKAGEYLVGELGPELVVNPQTGKWYTVGDNGAQFVHLPKGAIVFNHIQTEDLLRDGKTLSRALGEMRSALASGNALISGSPGVSGGPGGFNMQDYMNWATGGYSSSTASKNSGTSAGQAAQEEAEEAENWFEKQLRDHQHMLNMEQESVQEYLDWLVDAYPRAYDEGLFEIDEFYSYQEEVFEKLRELFQDSLDDIQHHIDMLSFYPNNDREIIGYYTSMMNSIKDEIEAAREYGLDDNSEYIQSLQDQYYDLFQSIKDLEDELVSDATDGLNDMIDIVVDMLKQRVQDQIDALEDGLDAYEKSIEDQKDALDDELDAMEKANDKRKDELDDELDALDKQRDDRRDILEKELKDLEDAVDKEVPLLEERLKNLQSFYDKQRELLDNQKEEEDYLKEQEERRKEVSDLENELSRLELDDSAWASKRKAELAEDLAKAREELDEFERDHALEMAKETLDAQEELQTGQLEAERDRLNQEVEDKRAAVDAELAGLDEAYEKRQAEIEAEKEAMAEMYEARQAAVEAEKEQLDALLEARQQAVQAEVDALNQSIENQKLLRQQALDYLKAHNETILQEMIAWNDRYGDGIDASITDRWDAAREALERYYAYYQEHLQDVVLPESGATDRPSTSVPDVGSSWNDSPVSGQHWSANGGSTRPPAGSGGSGSGGSYGSGSQSQTNRPYGYIKDYSGNFYYGSTGNGVKAIQSALNTLGYGTLDVDGEYGPLTMNAVKQFQKASGIAVDGIVGPDTKDAFYKKGYASGTVSAIPGIHSVDELGPEYIFQSKDGNRYRVFSGGEKVLNAKATNFLYNFANKGKEGLQQMFAGSLNRLRDLVSNNESNQSINFSTGDIVIQGNADKKTVSEIRRAQSEMVGTVLKKFKQYS